jgi:translation initiation factor 1A
MVKNKGGNKTKKKSRRVFRHRELGLKDLQKVDEQEYAFVMSVFGDGRYELMCYDKVKRLGILRGSLRRTARIQKNDVVLVSLRDFQSNKCDIVAHYSEEDLDKLIRGNKICISFTKNGELTNGTYDDFYGQNIDSESSEEEEIVNTNIDEYTKTPELDIDDI